MTEFDIVEKVEAVFKEALKKYAMLEGKKRVGVATSGGSDSVALLLLFDKFKKELGVKLIVLHFDHSLRETSSRDREFVENLADRLGLEFVWIKRDIKAEATSKKLSIEEAARRARYKWFRELIGADSLDCVATGHHMDDQAGTVIYRILRGTGPDGLSAIEPVGMDGKIIRPLLGVRKRMLEQYVRARGYSFVLDETNLSLSIVRNRIQQQIIPLLEEINPRAVESIAKLADIAFELKSWLKKKSDELLKACIMQKGESELFLDRKKMLELSQFERICTIRRALEEVVGDPFGYDYDDYKKVAELIADTTNFSWHVGRNVKVEMSTDVIRIGREESELKYEKVFEIPDVGDYDFAEIGLKISIRLKPVKSIKEAERYKGFSALLDADMVEFPLHVRFYREGDRFFPLGAPGEKSLADFFLDVKIPRFLRKKIPLLVSSGEVAWVIGYRISHIFRVTHKTKTALELFAEFYPPPPPSPPDES